MRDSSCAQLFGVLGVEEHRLDTERATLAEGGGGQLKEADADVGVMVNDL